MLTKPSFQYLFRTLACLALLASLFTAPFSQPVRAEENAPQAVILNVNSTADTNVADSNLTLREAIMVGNGGTGGSGLNRFVTSAEKALLTGCAFAANGPFWEINGGCGQYATSNSIHFSIPVNAKINLISPLPALNTSVLSGISIDGVGIVPEINAANIGAGQHGITITAGYNWVKDVIIKGSPGDNIHVTADYTIISYVRSINAGGSGIRLIGKYAHLMNNNIGVYLNACAGNDGAGVRVDASAIESTIENNLIGCNKGYGILVMSDNNLTVNQLIRNNLIGTDASNTQDWPNTGGGILIGSNRNVITGNVLGHNLTYGLTIVGNWNEVVGNQALDNVYAGILLTNSAQNNYIGCHVSDLCNANNLDGNRMSGNHNYGIDILGADAAFNIVVANKIGVNAAGNGAEGNLIAGVHIDGAHNNFIGGSNGRGNDVGGNDLSFSSNGIMLENGASFNAIDGNYVGLVHYNGGIIPLKNMSAGIAVLSGSHDNKIGESGATMGNIIAHNSTGIQLSGAGTTNNTVNDNDISANYWAGIEISGGAYTNTVGVDTNNRNAVYGNTKDGIFIGGAAHHNVVGYNYIGVNSSLNAMGNGRYGVNLSTGAHDNTIGFNVGVSNYIEYSGLDGVYVDGATTVNNSFNGNIIANNNRHGVNLTNGSSATKLIGNQIGTDGPNFGFGVATEMGANHNLIGVAGQTGNKIQYNILGGVLISGTTSTYNSVDMNLISYNQVDGIRINNYSNHNSVGSSINSYNLIVFNNGDGIGLLSQAHHNTLSYNYIGVSAGGVLQGNGLSGVRINGSSNNNQIAANFIAGNTQHGITIAGARTTDNSIVSDIVYSNKWDGINESAGAVENWWMHISTYANGGLGIDKGAADNAVNTITPGFPVLTSFNVVGNNVSMLGTALNNNAGARVVSVEIYAAAPDSSLYGEGKTYLTSVTPAANGTWSANFTVKNPGCYTVFQTWTDTSGAGATVTNSSEFSLSTCQRVFIPMVVSAGIVP